MATKPNLDSWIKPDGVRHDAEHSLRVDRTLTPGEAQKRNWRCTCGQDFGYLYDNAAKGAYRAHRKPVAPAPQARVTRSTGGDYRVMRGDQLVSNHGRRRAEAQAKADRINESTKDAK